MLIGFYYFILIKGHKKADLKSVFLMIFNFYQSPESDANL